MTIQRHLASFSVIASALEDLLVGGQIGACRILSADVGLARALERQVARLVEAVSTWPPRRLLEGERDRKSTRLNSSHSQISYAVLCLKKKRDEHQSSAARQIYDINPD